MKKFWRCLMALLDGRCLDHQDTYLRERLSRGLGDYDGTIEFYCPKCEDDYDKAS